MTLADFKNKLTNKATEVEFAETMAIIDELYTFTPTEFSNGDIVNEENKNNGSCKLFAFAQLQNFSKEETLSCFGQYYRKDVLENPNGEDHQNIRNFMTYGWDGIKFTKDVLKKK